jgi:hypothetical protein
VSTWIVETEEHLGAVFDLLGWLAVVEADADDSVGRVGREPTTDGP